MLWCLSQIPIAPISGYGLFPSCTASLEVREHDEFPPVLFSRHSIAPTCFLHRANCISNCFCARWLLSHGILHAWMDTARAEVQVACIPVGCSYSRTVTFRSLLARLASSFRDKSAGSSTNESFWLCVCSVARQKICGDSDKDPYYIASFAIEHCVFGRRRPAIKESTQDELP